MDPNLGRMRGQSCLSESAGCGGANGNSTRRKDELFGLVITNVDEIQDMGGSIGIIWVISLTNPMSKRKSQISYLEQL